MANQDLEDVLTKSRILVLLGAGGVGKTTTSIVMALLGAKAGRRVALLSIDPARRLATALGIPLGNSLERLKIPAALGISGSVDAAMLDQKAVFDAMVYRHAPSPRVASRILAHPVYKAASTNLSGPLEYMALAKLQELTEDARYDLIVLDTPPDTHALDFLARPNVLSGFMENRVMSWLIKPFALAGRFGLGRLVGMGEKLMGGIAKVTGVSALRSFADFLVLMQEVIEGFHQSGEKIVKLLHRQDTRFMLVTVPTLAAARSASNIATELAALGYRASLLLFNRCVPAPVRTDFATVPMSLKERSPALTGLGYKLAGEERVVAALAARVATAQAEGPTPLFLADREHDVGSLEALLELGDELERAAGR